MGGPYGPFRSVGENDVPGFGVYRDGQIITFEDPCEAAEFMDAALFSGQNFSPEPSSRQMYDRVLIDCAQQRGAGTYETVIRAPRPMPWDDIFDSDTVTVPDEAPFPEESNAEQMGAPSSPEENFTCEDPFLPPQELQGQTLTETYNSVDSMPDYAVLDNLSDQGFTYDEQNDAFLDVIHNEPAEGESHPYFGLDNRDQPYVLADPVDIFNGQYMIDRTDVHIPSRGYALRFTRMYRSGIVYYGPFGFNWDHNYNLYLRELNDGGVAIWTGRLTEHVYRLRPDGCFEPPIGVFARLEKVTSSPFAADHYALTDKDGMRIVFERLADWPFGDRLPLARIEDRHGNIHHLSYNADGKLEKVFDHAGRFIRLDYNDQGFVSTVSDHTHRTWQYHYDLEVEHLTCVTTPGVPGYPDGLNTRYVYDQWKEHPFLMHNILQVIGPDDTVIVENRYGDTPGTDDFSRVIAQVYEGFENAFHATCLRYVPRVKTAMNLAAWRVEVVDPGVLYVYTFNYRGNLLDFRYRLLFDDSCRLVVRRFRYDTQGNLIEQREPDGVGPLYEFDHENDDPLARGNLLRVVLAAPLSRPVPSREIARFTYEDRYGRVKTKRDESGALTTYIYDYEETSVDKGNVIRVEYPETTQPDGTRQQSIVRYAYNAFGQLEELITGEGHRHEYVYSTDGSDDGFLKRTVRDADGAGLTGQLEYNEWGWCSSFIDANGRMVEREINALGQVTVVRLPPLEGIVDEIKFCYDPNGHLRRRERPRGDYEDDRIEDRFIADEYLYDSLGHLTKQILGVNTARPIQTQYTRNAEGKVLCMIDSLARRTTFKYDERGLLLEKIEACSSEVEAVWRFHYDRSGNRTRMIDPAGHCYDYEYDIWHRLTRVVLPGSSDETRTRIDLDINLFDKAAHISLTGKKDPLEVGVLFETETVFDERGRPTQRSVGDRVTRYIYDKDDRVAATIDQRERMVRFFYDGLNRVVRVTDPLDNTLQREFDGAGNLVSVTSYELIDGSLEPAVFQTKFDYDSRHRLETMTLATGGRWRFRYDARDLVVSEIDPLDNITERSYGFLNELRTITKWDGRGHPVIQSYEYDLAGRQIVFEDPEGHKTRYFYDDRDRKTAIEYPDGRVHRFFYDKKIQVAREETPGGTRIAYTYGDDAGLEKIDFRPGPGVAETGSLRMVNDGLRRVIRIERDGKTLERLFDAHMRLVRESFEGKSTEIHYADAEGELRIVYPDARVDLFRFDLLDRLTHVTLERIGDNRSTGSMEEGEEIVSYGYQGCDRLLHRELNNGVNTMFRYDAGKRLSELTHQKGSEDILSVSRFLYDDNQRQRVSWSGPLPQKPTRYDYDALSRLCGADFGIVMDKPAEAVGSEELRELIERAESLTGESTELYDIDRNDLRTSKSVSGILENTREQYMLDTSGRIRQIDRTGGDEGVSLFSFDGDGRCTEDHRYRYTYNALGQVVEIRDLESGLIVVSQEFDPAGRVFRRTQDTKTYEQIHIGFRMLQRSELSSGVITQFTSGCGADEIVMESNGENRYPLQDHSLNVLLYTDDSANVLERYRYSPFGEVRLFSPQGDTVRSSSAIDGIPRFAGHPLLCAGLFDARARIYDAYTGRFLQPDPLGYAAGSNLYTYAFHNPLAYLDPTGEVGVLIGIAVAAGVGLVLGAGLNAIRQGLRMIDDPRNEFSWSELALSAGMGAVLVPLMIFVPELGILFAGIGIGSGISELERGNPRTGIFDIATAVAPFGLPRVRSATFGRGSVFAPSRNMGPSATASQRYGRFAEMGQSSRHLADRVWNEHFFHGTTERAAQSAINDMPGHLQDVREVQSLGWRQFEEGLYFTREIGEPSIDGSPMYWADRGNMNCEAGNPAILQAKLPRWMWFFFEHSPGVETGVPQSGFAPRPASLQTFLPFERPLNLSEPPGGPAVAFAELANWHVVDLNAPQPNLSSMAFLHPAANGQPIRLPGIGNGRGASEK